MGGLHSGRARRHTCIDDCLVIDTAWLNKQRLLQQDLSIFSIEWKKYNETNFTERKERRYAVAAVFISGASPQLTLSYQTWSTNEYGDKKQHEHWHALSMESTPCNYGGARWWFTAPCCQRRVRALYINPKRGDQENMTPQCRTCLDLHYPSQMASYIERHKTYERHLLANYGLYWAEHRYNFELKEHYLKMTPELWALREKSVYEVNMHLLKLVIRCDLMTYRMHIRNLRSLRSEEDRRVYIADMNKQGRAQLSRDLLERTISQTNTRDMDEQSFKLYERLSQPLTEDQAEEKIEQKITDLTAILQQVNKRVRKKAA